MKYYKLPSFLLVILFLPFISFFQNSSLKSQEKGINNGEKINDSNVYKDVYIIGPGDLLEIKFLNLDLQDRDFPFESSSTVYVLKDGSASIPFIGYVDLNDLTFIEATALIKAKLSKEIIYPEIQLKLFKERPIRVSLIGEVKTPGIYNLNKQRLNKTDNSRNPIPNNEISAPTLIDALIASGGITKNANIREVKIKRRLPKSLGGYKQSTIDLYQLILEGDLYQNLNLYDGDIITLSKVDSSLSYDHEIFKTNLSLSKIKIFVAGEVRAPGNILIDSNSKLLQAVFKAGGPINYRANKGRVDIIRTNSNGSISIKKYKLKLEDNVDDKLNPILQDGDIVRVSTSNLANVTDALQSVSRPISSLLNIYTFYRIISDD